VYPALAVADAYRAAFPDVQVRFAGTTDGPAGRLLASRGLPLDPVLSAPFGNVRTVGRLAAVPRIVTGTVQARRLLVAGGSRLVLGLGGYASGPVLLAGRSLGSAWRSTKPTPCRESPTACWRRWSTGSISAAPPWRPRSRPAGG
jgi:UDP-N-acetylglucosamine--N-acetylmuramyl-(pentapeptide) pyrophosphoryl-undecaprenol N-acetylglucosamine transferase